MKPVISPRAMSSSRTTGRSDAAIVERFRQYLEENQYAPLCSKKISADLGVSERTLRAACKRNLGMGPVRYRNERRMELVLLALLRANPERETVTQIAMDHDFWQLGRFSVVYRKLFGESPSLTLRRPADDLAFAIGMMAALRPQVAA
jgi:AraC-like DNA-binding protein